MGVVRKPFIIHKVNKNAQYIIWIQFDFYFLSIRQPMFVGLEAFPFIRIFLPQIIVKMIGDANIRPHFLPIKSPAGQGVTFMFKPAIQPDKKLTQYRKITFVYSVPIVVKADDEIRYFQMLARIIPSNPY